jgi:hypothetical protein
LSALFGLATHCSEAKLIEATLLLLEKDFGGAVAITGQVCVQPACTQANASWAMLLCESLPLACFSSYPNQSLVKADSAICLACPVDLCVWPVLWSFETVRSFESVTKCSQHLLKLNRHLSATFAYIQIAGSICECLEELEGHTLLPSDMRGGYVYRPLSQSFMVLERVTLIEFNRMCIG